MYNAMLYPKDLDEHHRTYPANDKLIEIEISLSGALGNGRCEVIGSDLTKEYVEINADYRS